MAVPTEYRCIKCHKHLDDHDGHLEGKRICPDQEEEKKDEAKK